MMFKLEYERRKKYIDELVMRESDRLMSPSPQLLQSIRYSIAGGGKRLRAILALEFFEHFGGKIDQSTECFLAAIELLHLYTLVHDDLPCMDDDDYRRGKLSNHKVFGESMALLCGDALLNYAYELMFRGCSLAKDKTQYAGLCARFAGYAGLNGVIGGQALEFELERKLDSNSTLKIYRHKTGDLICASALLGAGLAGAGENEQKLVEKFAHHFGIAFQVRDDLLDIIEKGAVEKNSLVGLIGEENANITLEENVLGALESLKKLKITSGFLPELTQFAAQRTK